MKKLTIEEVTFSRVKGGDNWGDTVTAACTISSALKWGYALAYLPVTSFCVGWGVSKLLYK
ncbi:hypothetical protein [Spirosoma sp.]|uniref:hypothetical protein n=1 Tax=Spirosoma sp. TaxID=1899569 RepID=UPI00261C8A1F|nr:hypothetical protein [Spirosoma sp.]MCX6215436.1 hypothetical protein [Spirosoma sp.]